MNYYKMIIILLMIFHLCPFFIFHKIVSGYRIGSPEEKRWCVAISIPINIIGNSLCVFLALKALFNRASLFQKLADMLHLYCSSRDLMRLASSVLICMIFAVFWAFLYACYCFGRFRDIYIEKRNKTAAFVLMSFVALISVMVFSLGNEIPEEIVITEFSRKMTMGREDPQSHELETIECGYVILKNAGNMIQEMDRLYLSTNPEDLTNAEIKNIKLNPGQSEQYVIPSEDMPDVRKSGKDKLYLSDKSGRILDQITIPQLKKEEACKLERNNWSIIEVGSESAEEKKIDAPTFSAESGFYEEEFSLTVDSESGTEIFYTVDGSIPTEASTQYIQPIQVRDRSQEANVYRNIKNVVTDYDPEKEISNPPVDKCFIVRAIAVDKNGKTSDVVTHSYFVGKDQYKNKKIISLVCDPEDLFGEEGIYVTGSHYDEWYSEILSRKNPKDQIDFSQTPFPPNFMQRGREWEREANFEMIDAGVSSMNQKVGIRIQGASHRSLPLKRFSVYARKSTSGTKWFDQPLVDGYKAHSIMLRDGIENVVTPLLVEDRDVAIQKGIPVTLFLNGEYWYDTFIQEKYNNAFFAQHFGLSQANISMIKADDLDPSRYNKFDKIRKIIQEEDFSKPEVYQAIGELMDIQSYIDYMCTNIYLANMDEDEDKNIVVWHTDIKENDTYGDGRWRWALFDMDLNQESVNREDLDYDLRSPAKMNTFKIKGKYVDTSYGEQPIFMALKKNPEFCKQFVLTFMDLVNYNFDEKHVQAVCEAYDFSYSYHNDFFRNRAKYIVPFMAEEFELKGTKELVTISSDRPNAKIQINTLKPKLSEENSFHGFYYTDYPVKVHIDDVNFSHWIVNSGGKDRNYYEKDIEIPVAKGGVRIRAIFK